MARWFSWLECRPVTAEVVGSSPIRVAICGNSSVVEHLLAKEGVASSNLVFRSMNCQPGSLLPGFLNLFRKE